MGHRIPAYLLICLTKLTRSESRYVFWTQSGGRAKASLVCVHLFSYKTETTLTSTTLVAYLVHLVITYVSLIFRLWLIKNGVSLVVIWRVIAERMRRVRRQHPMKNRSAVLWFTGIDEANPKESCKQPHCFSIQEVNGKILHEAVLDIEKLLDGGGNV